MLRWGASRPTAAAPLRRAAPVAARSRAERSRKGFLLPLDCARLSADNEVLISPRTSEEAMEVHQSSLSGVPLLLVTGDVDHSNSSALEQAVREAAAVDSGRLLVDLSECPYLDSGGLSVFLFAVRDMREKGWLGVIGPNPNLARLFEIVGLSADPNFRIFSTREDASASLPGGGS